MKILIDMNLSPGWVSVFLANNIDSVHWSTVGDAAAPDSEIISFARDNGFTIFTHDLDFGAMLALTRSGGPSVIQLRIRKYFRTITP